MMCPSTRFLDDIGFTQDSSGELNSKIRIAGVDNPMDSNAIAWKQQSKYIKESQRSYPKKTRLSDAFTPGPFDVVCARGKEAHGHLGNINFRKKVQECSSDYAKAESKMFKSLIVSSVVDWVRANAFPEGGFVKQINGVWYEVGDAVAREKTGQALRERNFQQYKSSTKAKRKRWKREHSSNSWDDLDTLGDFVRSNKSIEGYLAFMEQRRQEMGGNDAPDQQLLELFNHTNKLILTRIRTDPELGELASRSGNIPS